MSTAWLRSFVRAVLLLFLSEQAVTAVGRWIRKWRRWADRWGSDREYPVTFESLETRRVIQVRRDALLVVHRRAPTVWFAAEPENHSLDHVILDLVPAASRELPDAFRRDRYDTERKYFIRFREALLFVRSGVVMSDPGRIWADSAKSFLWGQPQLQGLPGLIQDGDAPRFRPSAALPSRVVEGPAMLLGHAGQGVYGHWLMDCLPGVVTWRDALHEGRLRLLTPPLHGWQRECLERLGVLAVTDQLADAIVCVRDLIVPSYLNLREVRAPSTAIRRTCAALKSGSGTGPSSAPALIFISRAGIPQRRFMTNEPLLRTRLRALGFLSIAPETLSIAEQIRIFSAAQIIVGAHGSGLANIVFAPPGCIVIDILPSNGLGPGAHWIFYLSAVFGHRFVPVVTPADGSTTKIDAMGVKSFDPASTYDVDIGAVMYAVEGALRQMAT